VASGEDNGHAVSQWRFAVRSAVVVLMSVLVMLAFTCTAIQADGVMAAGRGKITARFSNSDPHVGDRVNLIGRMSHRQGRTIQLQVYFRHRKHHWGVKAKTHSAASAAFKFHISTAKTGHYTYRAYAPRTRNARAVEIGRASCRERV
jgi:hypothetical protein